MPSLGLTGLSVSVNLQFKYSKTNLALMIYITWPCFTEDFDKFRLISAHLILSFESSYKRISCFRAGRAVGGDR